MQRCPERLGEFLVRHAFRSDGVDRTHQGIVHDGFEQNREQVIDGDPAQVLLAIPDATANSELERKQQLLEHPAFTGDHHAEPRMHHPDPGRPC